MTRQSGASPLRPDCDDWLTPVDGEERGEEDDGGADGGDIVRAWLPTPEPRRGRRWTSTWRRTSPIGPGAPTAS